MWGPGIYFAEKASYSGLSYAHRLGDGQKCIMLAKLLVGAEVELPPDGRLRMPPNKADGERYDTVAGSTGGSKVYIVYENGRAYPEYLVTYTN
jgi:hypothetical protein